MNANELIETTKKRLGESEDCLFDCIGFLSKSDRMQAEEWRKEIDYYKSLLSTLSRAKIRVTAKEKPTREDGRGCLCALDDMGDWNFKKWYQIADCPSTYVAWFIMPDVQLPEVTP